MTIFKPVLTALTGLFCGFGLVAVSNAHHSFSAEFDINKPVELDGEVIRMEWVNPHSWLHVNVVNEDGEEEHWRVEGGAPSALLRRGWNRNSLPPGTKIQVHGYQARDGSLRANANDIVFPDGRSLFIGSTGQGAAPERPDNESNGEENDSEE